MAKLDDLFEKKRESVPILDLSKATVNSKEDFRKLFDKVPDFKTKPERVRNEDVKIRDKDLTFKITKKEIKAMRDVYTMANPIPIEMRGLKLEDLTSVPIDWKMLTNLRPKAKVEEEYYSRLIELGKLELKTVRREKREAMMTTTVRKTKNKAGIIEMRAISCVDCGDEFCTGKFCGDFAYECYTRVTVKEPGNIVTSKKVGADVAATLAADRSPIKSHRSRKKKRIKRKSSKSKSQGHVKTSNRSKSEGRKKNSLQNKKFKHASGSKSD